MKIVRFVLCALMLLQTVSALDPWELYNTRYEYVQQQKAGDTLEELIEPFLMPETHPIKSRLDQIFHTTRAISSRATLVEAGFDDKAPEPTTKIIVTRHHKMKGYIFKIYTDDYLGYHHGEAEAYTYLRRARGAELVRSKIAQLKWEKYFKVPYKWIYAIPESSIPLQSHHFNRRYILVEEEMDLLTEEQMITLWQDGTMTKKHLDKLFFITTHLGLRGCCKCDNVPICKDGRMAFVDTQSNLRWPIAYNRLNRVLMNDMLHYWKKLTLDPEGGSVKRIIDH